MARNRKSNAEFLLEVLGWCFGGSPLRSAVAAMVTMILFCFVAPSVLAQPGGSPFAEPFRSLGDWFFIFGVVLASALYLTALWKWWRGRDQPV